MVYRKGASASGVNEVAAPRDSINLLKNAVSDRVSGASEDSLLTSGNKLALASLH
ncbi:hypothetical protein [uncultured Helicobacter sp.]|uniref:hypothetical protein n=1 Tax=uncultured Helicobacter sp. TaxID=175537 RepID=UPI0037525A1D